MKRVVGATFALFIGPLLALAQPELPDSANNNAHDAVLEKASPSLLAEVDRLKQEHKDRVNQAAKSAPPASEAEEQGLRTPDTPPDPFVIIAFETEDGGLIATEL